MLLECILWDTSALELEELEEDMGLGAEVDLDEDSLGDTDLSVTEGLDAVGLGQAAGLGEEAIEKGGLKPWVETCDTMALAK